MGQCVSFFTKKKSKVSPQIDGYDGDFPAPVGLHSAVREPSEDGSSFRSEFASSLMHSELGSESFSSSDSLFASTHWMVPSQSQEFAACYDAFFRDPSRIVSPKELEQKIQVAAAKRITRLSARTCEVPSKTGRLIQSRQDTATQQKMFGRSKRNGERIPRMKSDQRQGQTDSIVIGSSSQSDGWCFSAASGDKTPSLDNSASKSNTPECDSSLDSTDSELGRNSWEEEESGAGFDSPSSAVVTENSRPPNKQMFEAPLFIEDLEDMEGWSSDESKCETESEVEVELAPEREKGPEQLTIRGIPCELHKPKGKSPEVSLSGILSDDETKEEPRRKNGAQGRLGSTRNVAVQHVESQRRVIPDPIKEQENLTSKESGCMSLSGVVYNSEELRMMASVRHVESQKRVIPDPIKEQENLTSKECGCMSFSGVVYNNEELRMMAAVQHVESQKRVIPDPIREQQKSTSKESGCMSFSGVVYSNEELRLMADILGEHDQ